MKVTYTAICMESTKGYPDPLIYTVEIETKNMGDLEIAEAINDAVISARLDDLGDEIKDHIPNFFRVCFAWEGNLETNDLIFDWRT